MTSSVLFECTSLKGTGKTGVLKPDADGRYEIVVGGLNVLNSAGEWYSGSNEVLKLFENSGALMRRVKRGVLKGENGHPKWLPGMSENAFINRIFQIEEKNVCCLHTEFYLDFDRIKDPTTGKPIIAIISKVLPSGPLAPMMKAAFEQKYENVCFSVRGFTRNERVRGRTVRTFEEIVTFDYVTEPGIAFAEKYKSPSLERMEERTITKAQLTKIAIENERSHPTTVATESSCILTPQGLCRSLGWLGQESDKPHYLGW